MENTDDSNGYLAFYTSEAQRYSEEINDNDSLDSITDSMCCSIDVIDKALKRIKEIRGRDTKNFL